MFRPLAIFIGARYTRAKRRNHFISFISLTSMIGLALGVMAMITVLSVMNGLQQEISKRILGTIAHGTLTSTAVIDDWSHWARELEKNPEILAVAPHAELEGMLSFRGMMQPIQLQGVDPAEEARVSILPEHITRGSLESLQPGEFGVVIGEISARRFGLRMGDKVTLIIPEASATTAGGVTPRMQRLNIVGMFQVGGDMDGSLALINVSDAATLLNIEGTPALRLKIKDMYRAPQILAAEAGRHSIPFEAHDWTQTQGSLFNAMKMEKTMIGLLLLLIVAVAAFNIIATLIMVVSDKTGDIAILRTLGATPGQIMGIFMVQGTVIGVIGTLIGVIGGVLLALNVTELAQWIESLAGQPVFSADIYMVTTLPSRLIWTDVVLICTAALLMSFLSTLYPSWRAAQVGPAEALRYE